MTTMKILAILGHPSSASFNHAIVDAVCGTATKRCADGRMANLHDLAALVLLMSLRLASATEDHPRLIWREDAGITLDKVVTPKGFKVSPQQVAAPILARMSRLPWAVAYLFADSRCYYLGNADNRKPFPETPDAAAFKLDGQNGLPVSPRSDLASSAQEMRDTAAKVLLTTYSPPARTNWEPLVAAIKIGSSKTNVLETIRRFCPDAQAEGGDASGSWCSESYRLDDLWMLECGFLCTSNTLLRIQLSERLRYVWVDPPPGFTGTWTTYFANGSRSHEIQYKDGKYDGEFTAFRPDGSKCYVQHYAAHGAEGEDTGYFPSGRVMYKGVYKGGKQVGTWTWYSEDGTVTSTKDFDKLQ